MAELGAKTRAQRALEWHIHRAIVGDAGRSRWRRLGRWLRERPFAARLLAARLGLLPLPRAEDRRVLEEIILPELLRDPDVRTVLFVGCEPYTQPYEERFFAGREYWTLDPDAARRSCGARRHVVGRLEELERFFPPGHFDCIVCNGVYGWGLDTAEQCESAFAACHSRLRTGGALLLGWNALPGREPVPLETIASLARFEPCAFGPLGTARYLTRTSYRHMYAFYRSRGGARGFQLRVSVMETPPTAPRGR